MYIKVREAHYNMLQIRSVLLRYLPEMVKNTVNSGYLTELELAFNGWSSGVMVLSQLETEDILKQLRFIPNLVEYYYNIPDDSINHYIKFYNKRNFRKIVDHGNSFTGGRYRLDVVFIIGGESEALLFSTGEERQDFINKVTL